MAEAEALAAVAAAAQARLAAARARAAVAKAKPLEATPATSAPLLQTPPPVLPDGPFPVAAPQPIAAEVASFDEMGAIIRDEPKLSLPSFDSYSRGRPCS